MDKDILAGQLELFPEILRRSAEMIRELSGQVAVLAKSASREKVVETLRNSGFATTGAEAQEFLQKLSGLDPVEAVQAILAPHKALGEGDSGRPAMPTSRRSENETDYVQREIEEMLGQ